MLSVGVARHFEHNVQFQRLPITIPPAGFALMARAEIDFCAVRKRQFDLNNIIRTTRRALQRLNRHASSSVHGPENSRARGMQRRISRSGPLTVWNEPIGT